VFASENNRPRCTTTQNNTQNCCFIYFGVWKTDAMTVLEMKFLYVFFFSFNHKRHFSSLITPQVLE